MKVAALLASFIILLSSCGGSLLPLDGVTSTTSATYEAGELEHGVRVIFQKDNFTDLDDFTPPASPTTSHQCLGDVLKVYYVDGPDYTGTPTAFPTPSVPDTLSPTNRPKFVKNVSVDITNTYYAVTASSVVSTDSCSYRGISSTPISSYCADFDRTPATAPTPAVATPTPAATPTASPYYGTDYYRVSDDWCVGQGPVVSPDPDVTKAYVGGVSIDLDRTELGPNEDLIMMVTYHALNENSGTLNWPANLPLSSGRSPHAEADRTILKVNLIGTEQSLDTLLQVKQPRPWTDSNTASYPVYMKEIATLEDPFGSLRTEQVYIPLSQNGLIDRIRIDRVRGSYHLFQIDLYRLGNRAE